MYQFLKAKDPDNALYDEAFKFILRFLEENRDITAIDGLVKALLIKRSQSYNLLADVQMVTDLFSLPVTEQFAHHSVDQLQLIQEIRVINYIIRAFVSPAALKRLRALEALNGKEIYEPSTGRTFVLEFSLDPEELRKETAFGPGSNRAVLIEMRSNSWAIFLRDKATDKRLRNVFVYGDVTEEGDIKIGYIHLLPLKRIHGVKGSFGWKILEHILKELEKIPEETYLESEIEESNTLLAIASYTLGHYSEAGCADPRKREALTNLQAAYPLCDEYRCKQYLSERECVPDKRKALLSDLIGSLTILLEDSAHENLVPDEVLQSLLLIRNRTRAGFTNNRLSIAETVVDGDRTYRYFALRSLADGYSSDIIQPLSALDHPDEHGLLRDYRQALEKEISHEEIGLKRTEKRTNITDRCFHPLMTRLLAARGRLPGSDRRIDIAIDLSLMDPSEASLEAAMEIWARLILMCRPFRGVNFIFREPPRTDPVTMDEGLIRHITNAPAPESFAEGGKPASGGYPAIAPARTTRSPVSGQ